MRQKLEVNAPFLQSTTRPSPFSINVMAHRVASLVLSLVLCCLLALRVQGQAASCTISCGENAQCLNGICSCSPGSVSPSGSNNDCVNLTVPNEACTGFDSSCVYCGRNSEGPCLRCVDGMFLDGVVCVSSCPAGFQIDMIAGLSGLLGRTCMTGFTSGGDELPQWAVIVIAVIAVVLFAVIVIVVLGFALSILTRSSHGQFDIVDDSGSSGEELTNVSRGGTLRTRRSNSFSYENKKLDTLPIIQHNPNFSASLLEDQQETCTPTVSTASLESSGEKEIEGDDETVFYHKLDYLRTQAEVFLKMLNDMRRRLKEIPVDSAAAQQYRNVMQDVTRLLYLLNKRRSTVQMPPDGLQLMTWSEQILERYLSSQGVTLQRIEVGPAATNRLSMLGPQDETDF